MDPRRLLILAVAGLGLSGCAVLRDVGSPGPTSVMAEPLAPSRAVDTPDLSGGSGAAGAPDRTPDGSVPYDPAVAASPEVAASVIAPDGAVLAPGDGDAVVGGVQLFRWSPGRVYPVRTAPLRVTTLTLGPGETLVSKAAGDTVRWQIGETTSGEGAQRRAHVLIKPLQRGLETNLVLTTTRRVYFLGLASGGVDGFNTAVTWDRGALEGPIPAPSGPLEPVRVPDPVATPQGPLDARYRIEARGRRPRWTPVSVFNDGLRTFIAFGPDLRLDEAPALFVIAPDGEARMVNYRQAGGLFIVDRVFDRAELRLGGRRPQVVRIRRVQGGVR